MIVDVLERQRPFSLQNHPGPRPVEPAAEFAGPLVHRVEKDAVGLDSGDQFGQHLQIVLWLPARPGVPRVVVNEDFHVAAVASAAEVAQAVQAARHVAVEIELVAVVHANPRIGVPEHKAVVAAKLALAVVEEGQFVDGRWVAGRRLNGDETPEWKALWFGGDRYTIQKIRLYRYR